MDGIRVQLKNPIKNASQYLRSPNVNRSEDFKVSLRGWLYRLEGAALKQWKRRWCVLADYCLFYYKDMAEEKLLGSLLLPSYKISPCFSRDGISRKFAFKAEHSNMKTYYFSADSKEIQQQWMNALSMASIMQLSAIFTANESNGGNGKSNSDTLENNNRANSYASQKESSSTSTTELRTSAPPTTNSTSTANDDESGFVAYHQAKRLEETTTAAVAAPPPMYPVDHYNANFIPQYNMYNSVGLPVFYHHQDPNNGLSGYIDAPPKPQRQYYNLMLPYAEMSATTHNIDHHHHQYHQQDLANHNYFVSGDQTLVPYPGYLQINGHHYNGHFNNQTQTTIGGAAGYEQQHQRLPPRPHSADFLERNQDYDIDEECQTLFMPNGNEKINNQFRNDLDLEPRILPMRPKSSIEKYDLFNNNNSNTKGSYPSSVIAEEINSSDFYDQPKILAATSANSYEYNTEQYLPIFDQQQQQQSIVNFVQHQTPIYGENGKNETVPNRPPLPQEYVFRFQKNLTQFSTNNEKNCSVSVVEKTLEKDAITYTSDDEICRKNFGLPAASSNDDTFELSKEEYYKASKWFLQKQNSSIASAAAPSNASDSSSKCNYNMVGQNDWNEVGLPNPQSVITSTQINNSNNGGNNRNKTHSTNNIQANNKENGPEVQNQSNEELEIKFKLGLNVRTYKKPKPYHELNNGTHGTNYDSRNNQCNDADVQACEIAAAAASVQSETSPRNKMQSIIKGLQPPKAISNDSNSSKVENDLKVHNSSPQPSSSSSSTTSAPYYYSDLLNEEQKIALQKKLGDFASPPPLLSRCTASNNTRFLGTTSLTLLNNKPKKTDQSIVSKKNDTNEKIFNADSRSECGKIESSSNKSNMDINANDHHHHPTTENQCPNKGNDDDDDDNSVDPVTNSIGQPIYENCATSDDSPDRLKTERKKSLGKHPTNPKPNLTPVILNSVDSIHAMPLENTTSTKKKRRKRKSKENLNNASDSEVPCSNLERSRTRRGLLKSSRRFSVSAAEYVGKSHEELILMLIQLRRRQSQLSQTSEKLRIQMDSEEKMMEIEPHRRNEYEFRFNELNRKLIEINREYELQMPIIQTIDHMIKIKSNSKLNELNKKKAASTSVLDKVTMDGNSTFDNHHHQRNFDEQPDSDTNRTPAPETPNENIEILKKQQRVLEGELDRVRGMLTHSTKKLEEKAVENAQMEQEMLIARNKLKQVLENEQEAMEITRSAKLEAELAHINKVIDDLHSRRKELNNAIENLKISEARYSFEASQTDHYETGLYPLYENIKKSQEFLNHHGDNDDDDDDDDEDDEDPANNNNLNDEFFTLNINLDKHSRQLMKNNSEINNNQKNINTMCQFDPNKDMALAYGDSIVDQQIKQIYNYHHHHQQQPVIMQKSTEAKTVREVKRESERRKYHHQRSNVGPSGSSRSSNNYESSSYSSSSHNSHYFNGDAGGPDDDDDDDNDLNNHQPSKLTNHHHQTNNPEHSFITPPDIVQSTIKFGEKI